MKQTHRHRRRFKRKFILAISCMVVLLVITILIRIPDTDHELMLNTAKHAISGIQHKELNDLWRKSLQSKKNVYLTFDDGPCSTTPQLLDVLDKYNVKATFFVTAQFMNKKELIAMIREIDRRGHTVAVHSYSHDYGTIYNSVEAYLADFDKMDDIIFEATGKRSRIFRFPGGSNTGYNEGIREELLSVMQERGLVYFDWNAYDGDCDGYDQSAMIERAVKESSYSDHSILLMHNIPGKNTVIHALPEIIRQLDAQGHHFPALDESVKTVQFS